MVDRIAIKRLTASDCTLFEAVFRQIDAGNQKSINLNADVLIGRLYPNLAAVAASTDNEIALAISIYGPSAKHAHRLSRKIIKNATYKNWRLNGEFIPGPPGDTSRYDGIKPGDLAIMAFKGETAPSGLDLILISRSDLSDAPLYNNLAQIFGNKSMVAVDAAQIATAALAASVPESHPVFLAAADPVADGALEDAAQGGIEGIRKLLSNKGGRKISASDLARAKSKAELVGQEGEGLVNGYLAQRVVSGKLTSYVWASDKNAVAPYDFEVVAADGGRTLIDAKTTGGPFDNVIHLSLAEVIEASGATPYIIYRVFDLNDDGGKLRISGDIHVLAEHLKTIHETHMPPGIRIDGFSVATSALTWGAEEYVARADGEEAP